MTRWRAEDLTPEQRAQIPAPAAATAPRLKSEQSPEDRLAWQLEAANAPTFDRQMRIHPERKFRADFWFSKARLVVEVDGGGFINGRHSRGTGIERDAEKSALIAAMPARLMRVTPKQINNGSALEWILRALKVRTA